MRSVHSLWNEHRWTVMIVAVPWLVQVALHMSGIQPSFGPALILWLLVVAGMLAAVWTVKLRDDLRFTVAARLALSAVVIAGIAWLAGPALEKLWKAGRAQPGGTETAVFHRPRVTAPTVTPRTEPLSESPPRPRLQMAQERPRPRAGASARNPTRIPTTPPSGITVFGGVTGSIITQGQTGGTNTIQTAPLLIQEFALTVTIARPAPGLTATGNRIIDMGSYARADFVTWGGQHIRLDTDGNVAHFASDSTAFLEVVFRPTPAEALLGQPVEYLKTLRAMAFYLMSLPQVATLPGQGNACELKWRLRMNGVVVLDESSPVLCSDLTSAMEHVSLEGRVVDGVNKYLAQGRH